jgi:hypothetical protein
MHGEVLWMAPSPDAVSAYERLYGEYCRKRDLLFEEFRS